MHPCQLVSKYTSDEHWETMGEALMGWLEKRDADVPDDATCLRLLAAY